MFKDRYWKGFSLFLLCFFIIGAGFKAVDDQYLLWKNMNENPGFENGIGSWTTSGGTLATTTTAANVASGQVALSFDGSAAAQIAENVNIAVPPALYGQACRLFFDYKGGGTANYTVAVNNGGDLGTLVISAAATNYTTDDVVFTCPTSGSLHIEITSAGDGAEIFFDNFWIGRDLLTTFGGGGGSTLITPENNAEYLFSIGMLWTAGTPTTRTNGDPDSMISSYTDTGTGDVTMNLNAVCTATSPVCTCSATQGGLICAYVEPSSSNTALRFVTTSHTGSAQDANGIEVNCRCSQ